MRNRVRVAVGDSKLPRWSSVRNKRKTHQVQSATSPVGYIKFLQRTLGNQAVQEIFKSNITPTKARIGWQGGRTNQEDAQVNSKETKESQLNSFSHSLSTSMAQLHRDSDTAEGGTPSKTPERTAASKPVARPTGIEKTEVNIHCLHFGARYKHTLKSSGGDLEGIHVTEKVTAKKDDFGTNLPGVKLGKFKAIVNKSKEISDRIWISFGAIAPAVERLRKRKKPGEMLLGKKVSHQELYYWDNRKPPGWKKFTDVTIEQRLYDVPGLYVVTLDNDVMAQQEEFTLFLPQEK